MKGSWLILLSIGIVAGFVLVLLALSAMNLGSFHPQKDSSYAQRAKAVDASLRPGMTRQEARNIFDADIAANPTDSINAASDLSVLELVVTEPRRFPWDTYDAAWVVRASFNRKQTLIRHGEKVEPVNGP